MKLIRLRKLWNRSNVHKQSKALSVCAKTIAIRQASMPGWHAGLCSSLPTPYSRFSVVIRATEVVAAVGADELAFVAGEAVRAVGADLAVMIDGRVLR